MFRPCILVPTYNNPATVRRVVERVRAYCDDVLVIDDGSAPQGRAAVEQLAQDGLAVVRHRPQNGGKGAAVKTGLHLALELGYTHALQVDADGQHDLDAIPRFLQAAEQRPDALVLARPEFAVGTPRIRRMAREITNFWVHVETFGRAIADAMIGFRVYPVAATLAANPRTERMDFDIEVAVRLVWHGVGVLNLPIAVRYLTADEGGISHFRLFSDNARISWLHTRLVVEGILRKLFGSKRFGLRLEAP
jgi:glycosyltransferase involved in cell wall biosynthesis